ncbi:MAG TPA: DUF4340 domain-containing protein [Polyangiaceae bacterium]|nr:DUF4340 domain-containing protein [Polyangiaceae bacterium]
MRELGVHVFLLAASIAAALSAWTGQKGTSDLDRGDLFVWKGQPEDIVRIVYEGANYKTTIEPKHDAVGSYFSGKYEKSVAPGEQVTTPDNLPAFVNQGDKPLVMSQTFIATKAGSKLIKDLAPLKALRAIGRISKDQRAEFGLDAPKTSAIVTFRNLGARRLQFGAETLGEKNQYVLDEQTEQAYVLLGDLARDISQAHERLPERDLHAWLDMQPTSARIKGRGRTRNLVRGGPQGSTFWADSASASKKDATATNWMAKIDELRVVAHDPTPQKDRSQVLRIEYARSGEQQGFLELWKGPAVENRSHYWVRTEQTRMLARVFVEQGEQIEQDVNSVLR